MVVNVKPNTKLVFKWVYRQGDFTAPHPLTLQQFLQARGFSKSQIARLKFSGGQIFVNQRQRHTDYRLHDQDLIRVFLPPETASPSLVPSTLPLTIVYEDRLFLVVNKPAGVPSIPSRQHPKATMANRVKGYLMAQQQAEVAVHLVTRLDMDTSGLMIFAKNGYGHSLLAQQGVTQQLKKTYLAIIPGHLQRSAGLIDLPIRRERPHRMKRIVNEAGKSSQTRYQVLAETKQASLVQLQLLTGRTHQIRVHLAALGHPLYGDELYAGPGHEGIKRQALHCCALQFYQPFQQRAIQLQAALPLDMQKLWQNLNEC